MDGRKRTVQIKFRVTEAERDLILESWFFLRWIIQCWIFQCR